MPRAAPAQVVGADFRFQERMRGVIEYMQYREMPAEIKRKVRPRRPREGNLVVMTVQGQPDSVPRDRRARGSSGREAWKGGGRTVEREESKVESPLRGN